MSEFQYYEFNSIDKELTKQERQEVDGLSSRFSPTSRRAIFTYSYSDFRHNEESILLKYFDFFLYWSNWGIKRIMYKLPKELVNYKEVLQYDCSIEGAYTNEGIHVYQKSNYVVIDIKFSDEEDYWIEEDNHWSSDLIGLRQDILDGDYRSLFIIWLHANKLESEHKEINEEIEVPKQMIPDNLENITNKLECLMKFFEVDVDWVMGASKFSKKTNSKEKDYSELIKIFPQESKDQYLAKLLKGESNLRIKLKKELDNIARIPTKKIEYITFKELRSSIKDQKEKRIRIKMPKMKKED